MRRRIFQICPAVFVLVLLSPRYVLAQWVTWHQFGTEGSYVHETAHFLGIDEARLEELVYD